MRDFRKLDIWMLGVEITKQTYLVTKKFPASERYGLANQMQRAAVSLPSNIAEGASRKTNPDFARFLELALGSAFELETQMIIAKDLEYITKSEFEIFLQHLQKFEKQLNSLLTIVRGNKN